MSSVGVSCDKGMGWQKNTMQKVYISLIRSCLYCISLLQFGKPDCWQRDFNVWRQHRTRLCGLWRVRQMTTSADTLIVEAGVCRYKTVSNRLCVRAHETAIRLPADHSKKLALCGNNQHHLQRSSLREQASCLLDSLPSELRTVTEFAPYTFMDQPCRQMASLHRHPRKWESSRSRGPQKWNLEV